MPLSGDIVVASDIDTVVNAAVAAVRTLWVRKPSDTSRASNTTPSADPGLIITVPAGTYYHLSGTVIYAADTAADLKGGLYGPANATFSGTYRAAPTSVAGTSSVIVIDAQALTNAFGFGGNGAGTNLTAFFDGIFYSGDGGSMGFTWAQQASSATATIVRTNSYITLGPLV